MTKTEFGKQFQRLRVAGYRLPVFDGVTVADVVAEWFDTFKGCTVEEFSEAIDRLKQHKTDTWWPATGEIWALVFDVRKARALRNQCDSSTAEWPAVGPDIRQQLAAEFRDFAHRLSQKMTMPNAAPQVTPDDRERQG